MESDWGDAVEDLAAMGYQVGPEFMDGSGEQRVWVTDPSGSSLDANASELVQLCTGMLISTIRATRATSTQAYDTGRSTR